MRGYRVAQGYRDPPCSYAAEISHQRQERKDHDARQNAGEGQQFVGIYGGGLNGIDLLGYFHRAQLSSDASSHSSAHH